VQEDARALVWRLTAAYLWAFALILLIFAAAVHLAYSFDLQREERSRLDDLLAAASGAYDLRNGAHTIDEKVPQLADTHLESVTWFDSARHPVAHEGDVPKITQPPVAGVPIKTNSVWAECAATPYGLVRATVRLDRDRHALVRADLGLVVGFLVALIAATFGGKYLASRAIVRVVASMRAQRDFTADAAHELRGPLAALRSNADASLRDDADLPLVHRTRLETIEATARDMSRTVDDLLLLARAETPLADELFAIDLEQRIGQAVDARRAIARSRGVALAVTPSSRARIYGNPTEIDRVLGNLIDNAVRFTAAGGSVDVATSAERGGFVVVVRDTGVGIAAQDLPKIFARFWRGDPARSGETGTGLGLAIVRALVRRHGGDIAVQSTLGRGSEFAVWFPQRPPQRNLRGSSTDS